MSLCLKIVSARSLRLTGFSLQIHMWLRGWEWKCTYIMWQQYDISCTYSGSLARAPAGYLAEYALVRSGGGLILTPLPNSRNSGRSGIDEITIKTIHQVHFKQIFKFSSKGHKSGQGQIKVKITTFRTIGCRDVANNSFESKVYQNTSQRMDNMPYKYRPYTK